jgi:hypothetical protein
LRATSDLTHLLDHDGGDGGDLANVCVRGRGVGKGAKTCFRATMRLAPSSGGGAGTRSNGSMKGVALSLASTVDRIWGADVDANGSIELKKYLGSVWAVGHVPACRTLRTRETRGGARIPVAFKTLDICSLMHVCEKKNDELKRTRSGSKLNHVLDGGNIGTGGSLKTWIQQFNTVKMSSERNFF